MFKFFTNIIIKILYKFIESIEKYEYRHLNLNEDDISKKILNSIKEQNIKVLTDTGYETLSELHITQPYKNYKLKTKNHELICADNHIIFDKNYNKIFVKNISKGDLIQTENGLEEVIYIKSNSYKTSMFDGTIEHINHRFYTNGILSHNTVSSSIMLLHFLLFNNNKNALVTANKLDTAIEVLDKMGEIYQRLPFFLQQGIKNWNQKMKVFENKSRVKGFATTKTASIGQTADFLYLDEFAYLPDNIAEKFYKSVFPTVSNIENSKIIITSTPNGYNLFHKLLTEAEKPEGEKSSYVAKRVYWWQVPKRFVTYIRLKKDKLLEKNIKKEDIFEYLTSKYPNHKIEIYFNDELKRDVINVYNNNDLTEDDIIREVYNDIKLLELSDITTWKKETIKDIGGEEAFNQEYDLRFINSSRSLLEEALINELDNNKEKYEHEQIDELDKLKFSTTELKWIKNKDIYDNINRKKTKVIISVDISEGLGQDYSVINIFKLGLKPHNLIERQLDSYKNTVDFIQLKQIGMYRSNIISVEQLAELFYILVFEHFDPENVKVVVELNAYGYELLAHLPNIFEGDNDYGSFVFFRYKHRVDSDEEKIGLKVGNNKNLLVKEYQDRMQSRSIDINEEESIKEASTFIKHTTSAGNITYAADGSATDDIIMTIVDMSSIFNKNEFKTLVEDYLETITDEKIKSMIDIFNKKTITGDSIDYKQLLDIRKRNISQNRRLQEARKNWGLDN
jgi:hypothetical protein